MKSWLCQSILLDTQRETTQDDQSEADESSSRNSDNSSTSNLEVNPSFASPKDPQGKIILAKYLMK